jgi:hypothetical protein
MGSYAEIDPEIERWVEKHSLILNSSLGRRRVAVCLAVQQHRRVLSDMD